MTVVWNVLLQEPFYLGHAAWADQLVFTLSNDISGRTVGDGGVMEATVNSLRQIVNKRKLPLLVSRGRVFRFYFVSVRRSSRADFSFPGHLKMNYLVTS